MKIGIDLHGVIDAYPEKFKSVIRFLNKTRNYVHIVTGVPAHKAEIELKEAGLDVDNEFYYLQIHSIVDFLLSTGVQFDLSDPENPWCDDQIWWDSKARICKTYEIEFLIDDSWKYKSAFDLIDAEFIHVSEIVGK